MLIRSRSTRLLIAAATVSISASALQGAQAAFDGSAEARKAAASPTNASAERRTFPVARFGAAGDGRNDIAALRRAVEAANAAKGGDVVLAARTYVVKTTSPYEIVLAPRKGTRIVGVKGSRLKADPASADGPVMIRAGDSDVAVHRVAIDMSGKRDAIAFRLDGASRARITASKLINVGTAGVYLAGATSKVLIHRNSFVGAGYGVLAHDASTARDVDIVGNTFVGGPLGDAIEINTPTGRATDWRIVDNVISGYSGDGRGPGSGLGIGIAHASRITITGNSIHDIGWRGIHMEDGTTDVVISGNTISSTAQEAVYAVLGVKAMRNIRVSDNTFVGNGTAGHSGVYFVPGGIHPPFSNVTVTGNTFLMNGAGGSEDNAAIRVDGYVSDSVIADNFITNQFGSYPGGRGVGLSISGTGGSGTLAIVKNTVVNGAVGLILHGSMNNATARDNLFVGHTVASIINRATGNIRSERNIGR